MVWVDRAGKVVGRAVNEPVDAPRDPALSPDGTRLAAHDSGAGQRRHLGATTCADVNRFGSRSTGDDRSAVWSPDGKRIVFTSCSTSTAPESLLQCSRMAACSRREPLRDAAHSRRSRGLGPPRASCSDRPQATDCRQRHRRAARRPATDAPRPVVATEYARDAIPRCRRTAAGSPTHPIGRVRPRSGCRAIPRALSIRVSNNGGYEPRWSADGRELLLPPRRRGARL